MKSNTEYDIIRHVIGILSKMCAADEDKIIDKLTGYLWDEGEARGIKSCIPVPHTPREKEVRKLARNYAKNLLRGLSEDKAMSAEGKAAELKKEITHILQVTLDGTEPRYRNDKFIRWGLVEKEIHEAVDKGIK